MGDYGFKKLIVWKNAQELRKLIYELTSKFLRSEMRRVSQMRDAARSVKQNIQEGYMKHSTVEYIRYLNVSQGSLGELSGDVDDCFEDKLISEKEFSAADSLIKRTDYLFKKLILSLREKVESQRAEGRKKNPFKPLQSHSTLSNP